jgi:hypothetical protein
MASDTCRPAAAVRSTSPRPQVIVVVRVARGSPSPVLQLQRSNARPTRSLKMRRRRREPKVFDSVRHAMVGDGAVEARTCTGYSLFFHQSPVQTENDFGQRKCLTFLFVTSNSSVFLLLPMVIIHNRKSTILFLEEQTTIVELYLEGMSSI